MRQQDSKQQAFFIADIHYVLCSRHSLQNTIVVLDFDVEILRLNTMVTNCIRKNITDQ